MFDAGNTGASNDQCPGNPTDQLQKLGEVDDSDAELVGLGDLRARVRDGEDYTASVVSSSAEIIAKTKSRSLTICVVQPSLRFCITTSIFLP